jgi:integrase
MGIYKRGAVFWARWEEGGTQKRRSLDTKNRVEAEALFEQLTSEDTHSLAMREILKLWLKYQTPRCKPHSIRMYKTACKRLTMNFGDLRPEEINTLLIEKFQDSLLMVGLSPRTINFQVGIALSAIRWAHDRELIEHGPPKSKPLKVKRSRSRKYLTADELKKLMTKLREPRWQRLTPFVMIALYAGLRQQEIAWLTWEDVDLVEGWIHVRSKKTWSPKSLASERSVPIADELAAYLTNTPRTCRRWVAPLIQKRWQSQHLGAETRRLFKAAGVDDGGPHTLHRLRGTFATTVLRGGGDLESLRQVLGHSALSVTAGYLEATSESKRRAVGGLSFGGG